MYQIIKHRPSEAPWKKGKIVGQELPLKLHETWAIRTRLQIEEHVRDLALFNLAVDSKLRASDLVRLRVSDVATSGHVCSRATILQKKTSRPVQFEITPRTRDAIEAWISKAQLATPAYLFPSRFYRSTVRHPLIAPHKSVPDIPPNEESESDSAVARARQAGKHGAVSGHRN
jgi:integrase